MVRMPRVLEVSIPNFVIKQMHPSVLYPNSVPTDSCRTAAMPQINHKACLHQMYRFLPRLGCWRNRKVRSEFQSPVIVTLIILQMMIICPQSPKPLASPRPLPPPFQSLLSHMYPDSVSKRQLSTAKQSLSNESRKSLMQSEMLVRTPAQNLHAYLAAQKILPSHSSRNVANLLDVPIHRLLDQLSSDTAVKLVQASVSSEIFLR